MGAHSRADEPPARERRVYPVDAYRGRHMEYQPGGQLYRRRDGIETHRRVDGIPDEWFDAGIDRSPSDPDVGVRAR